MINQNHVVSSVRQTFPRFYATGNLEDGVLLDALALARAALLLGMGTPRDQDGGEAQAFLEKATDAIERRFTELRERVRESKSFQIQTVEEQARIEAALFTIEEA